MGPHALTISKSSLGFHPGVLQTATFINVLTAVKLLNYNLFLKRQFGLM
jgi:hypothetical protein